MAAFNEIISQLFSNPYVLSVLLIWTSVWKGLGLWTAARKKHLTWFILILLFNTLGLLEIGYVFYLSKWDLGSRDLLSGVEKKIKFFKKK
jgi:hypothetical protein